MTAPSSQQKPLGGLTAAELALAMAAIEVDCAGARVTDVARLHAGDDLLIFLETREGARRALHVVPGSVRGRVTITSRRFARHEFATGPLVDALRGRLDGARIERAAVESGERIARLTFRSAAGEALSLVVEVFGNRGLWCLLDDEARMLDLSRLPKSAGRDLNPGARWTAPPAHVDRDPDAPGRFPAPILERIDAAFTASDLELEAQSMRSECAHALARAQRACAAQIAGLTTQLAQADEAPALRARADLMLAYAHLARRGADTLRVPDPVDADAFVDLPLDPLRPVPQQAKAMYDRARRLEDAIVVATTRRAEAELRLAELEQWERDLEHADDATALADVRARLLARRLIRAVSASPGAGAASGRTPTAKAKVDAATAYRRYVSAEGYDIFCGRDNQQNDRLTRTARGNDVWLHIGRGYAGSHVVVRVPKGKNASLETLLDAGTIAVHFSKARGADKADVIYTLAKHVRKPKGSAPGSVVPHHTKTLQLRVDTARLRRLLDGTGEA